MTPWGHHQDGEEWYYNNEDNDEVIRDFLNDPSVHSPLESRISRLAALAWKLPDTKSNIKAIEKLVSELGSDYTRYDYEHLVKLWGHEVDDVAEAAVRASIKNPPSRGKSYSVEMKLGDDDDPYSQIIACEILSDIFDKRVAEVLYSLAKRGTAEDEAREEALKALCGLGNLTYFKKIHKMCNDTESMATSSNLESLLENFHRVEDKKKRAVEYAGIVNWILAREDNYIGASIHTLAIGTVNQLEFFKAKKTQRDELVVLLEGIGNGHSEASDTAKKTLKRINHIKVEETKIKERNRNFKQTRIRETDSERKAREGKEESDRESERKKNFLETQIRETDEERRVREKGEGLERQRETNFLETQIRETDHERSRRELPMKMAKLNEELREKRERIDKENKLRIEREKKEIVENFSKYGVTAKDEQIEPLILVIDSPHTVSEDDIPGDPSFRLFLTRSEKSRELVFKSISVIAERSEILETTRIRIVDLALFYCRSAKIEERLIHFTKLREALGNPSSGNPRSFSFRM